MIPLFIYSPFIVHFRPRKEVFSTLANDIATVFSKETSKTYYTPAIKAENSPTGKSIPCSGKIPIRWRNYQQQLSKYTKKVEEINKQTDGTNRIFITNSIFQLIVLTLSRLKKFQLLMKMRIKNHQST